MKRVRVIALLVLVAMLANVVHVALKSGMNHGVGMDTFLAGARDPWQLFINCDLVAGLLFMVAWMALRDRGAPLLPRGRMDLDGAVVGQCRGRRLCAARCERIRRRLVPVFPGTQCARSDCAASGGPDPA
jgi:hypothetical protein